MSAYSQVSSRFGPPHVDVFAEDQYRVVIWNWHVHVGVSHGPITGCGKDLESACKGILEYVAQPWVRAVEGQCDWRCCRDYDQSEKSQKARAEFWRALKASSELV